MATNLSPCFFIQPGSLPSPSTARRTPSRPARSAESTAFLRALGSCAPSTDGRNPDGLAEIFLGRAARAVLRLPRLATGLSRRLVPGGLEFHVARTLFFDDFLFRAVQAGVRQGVILGAGYDSRAWRLASELGDSRVFELDLRATQLRKRGCLKRRGLGVPERLHLIGADLTHSTPGEILTDSEFDLREPTWVIWEGVSPYLPPEAVESTLRWAAGLPAGSSIAFDYVLRSMVEGDRSARGARQVAGWLTALGEPLRCGWEPEELADLLGRLGLAADEDLGPEGIAERFLESAVADAPSHSRQRPFGFVRFARAGVLGEPRRNKGAEIAPGAARGREEVVSPRSGRRGRRGR